MNATLNNSTRHRYARAVKSLCCLNVATVTLAMLVGVSTSLGSKESIALRTSHDTGTVEPDDGGLWSAFLPSGDWSRITLKVSNAAPKQPAGAVEITIANPSPAPLEFSIAALAETDSDATPPLGTWKVHLPGNFKGKLALQFAAGSDLPGMRDAPPSAADITLTNTRRNNSSVDSASVRALRIYVKDLQAPMRFKIGQPSVVPLQRVTGIVDAYGQFALKDWPGKIHSDGDLTKDAAAEAHDLQSNPAFPDRDEYGGLRNGPTLKASGYFRTQKVGSKWWLVTPTGHLFFSVGVDSVYTTNETRISGREHLFGWTPPKHGRLSSQLHSGANGEQSYNFYEANLERKYRQGYMQTWKDVTARRLKSWGFNTLGNWSAPSLCETAHMPYAAPIATTGGPSFTIGKESMPDVYAAAFRSNVEDAAGKVTASNKSDRRLIGYFVDNELPWSTSSPPDQYALARAVLASTAAEAPAKQEFVRELKEHYSDISQLNSAWSAHYAGWDDLSGPVTIASGTSAQLSDMSAFQLAFARRYFQTVHQCLLKDDPNHLYLGCRFAWMNSEALKACAEEADVISFNIYKKTVDPNAWKFVADLGKPCIVGEFHFSAPDRGVFGKGMIGSPNQETRAKDFENYVRSVAANPSFVGCHWFKYIDEPITGTIRTPENAGIGFVDIADTPYPELVEAARHTNRSIYSIRQANN